MPAGTVMPRSSKFCSMRRPRCPDTPIAVAPISITCDLPFSSDKVACKDSEYLVRN